MKTFKEWTENGPPRAGDKIVIIMRGIPGSGKCFGKNTPILMFDGSVKTVQNICVGDKIMGDDSTPRIVLSLAHGQEELFEIKPIKGSSFIVNKSHLLILKNSHKQAGFKNGKRKLNPPFHQHSCKQDNCFIINVGEYLHQSKHFKEKMKLFRHGIELPYIPVKIDPYILGVWLGDGTAKRCEVTTQDIEIADALCDEANDRGLLIRQVEDSIFFYTKTREIHDGLKWVSTNSFYNDLKSYDLIKNKHVPTCYLQNSRSVRLNLLAGLLDTDGHLENNGFDFINKNQQIANSVVFLARSLGLAAYIKPCEKICKNNGKKGLYHRVNISGNTNIIPMRIERKKAGIRKQIKNVLHTGFEVTPVGVGEYFGFTIDGNHRFLLGDFTVVHNSFTARQMLKKYGDGDPYEHIFNTDAYFMQDVLNDRREAEKNGGPIDHKYYDDLEAETYRKNWSAEKLGVAHGWNFYRFKKAIDQKITPLVVDNTNTQAKEMRNYCEYAEKAGYKIIIQEPESPWWKDHQHMLSDKQKHGTELENFARFLAGHHQGMSDKYGTQGNQHGVPLDTIRNMLRRWQPNLSPDDVMGRSNKFEKK